MPVNMEQSGGDVRPNPDAKHPEKENVSSSPRGDDQNFAAMAAII
jgi:hypothetical protein